MTLDEARDLLEAASVRLAVADRAPITVRRGKVTWTGRLKGVMAQPSLILLTDDGCSVALGLDGLTVEEGS